MINIDDIIERDVDRCGSYVAIYYELPREELDEEMRYQLNKPIFAITSDSDNCQKGE